MDEAGMRRRKRTVWLTGAVAGALGGMFSYAFGEQIGGGWLSVVLALNGGVCAALLAASGIDRLLGRRDTTAGRPGG